MKRKLNWKHWLAGTSLLAGISALVSYLYIDHELTRMYGGLTTIAEHVISADKHELVAITNVNVLAPTSDYFSPSQTVIIRDGIITSVSSGDNIPVDANLIDATGMFLVPGYTESHAHLWQSENDLLLFLANGITQVREMNGSKQSLRWKEEIEAGRLGPDLYVVAPQLATFGMLEGLFVGWTQNKIMITSGNDADRTIKSLKSDGYDAVKASSFLDVENFLAVNVAAHKHNMPLVGHIPNAIGQSELWASTQEELAHIEELVKMLDAEFGDYTPDTTEAFLDYIRLQSDAVAERLLENEIVVTTTLTLSDSFWKQKKNLGAELDRVELEYVNPGISEGTAMTSRALAWLGDRHMYRWPEDITEENKERSLTYWKAYAEAHHIILDALIRADVNILVGTDTNVPTMVPGFSLHDEMVALYQAGMSTADVLASATRIPGDWMGMNTGQISPGYKANLVLLKENPLNDIGATDTIETVFVKGSVLSRADLDEALRAVKAANDKSRSISLPNH